MKGKKLRTNIEISRTYFTRFVEKILMRYGGDMCLSSLHRMLVHRGYEKSSLVEALSDCGFIVDQLFDRIRLSGLEVTNTD